MLRTRSCAHVRRGVEDDVTSSWYCTHVAFERTCDGRFVATDGGVHRRDVVPSLPCLFHQRCVGMHGWHVFVDGHAILPLVHPLFSCNPSTAKLRRVQCHRALLRGGSCLLDPHRHDGWIAFTSMDLPGVPSFGEAAAWEVVQDRSLSSMGHSGYDRDLDPLQFVSFIPETEPDPDLPFNLNLVKGSRSKVSNPNESSIGSRKPTSRLKTGRFQVETAEDRVDACLPGSPLVFGSSQIHLPFRSSLRSLWPIPSQSWVGFETFYPFESAGVPGSSVDWREGTDT